MQKVSFVNKKIKSIFFGAAAMNEEQDEKPEIEVEADYQIPTIKQAEVKQEEIKLSKTRSLNMIERPKL